MSESAIQRSITDMAVAHGYKVYRLNSGGRRGRVRLLEDGTPDLLIVLRKGRSLWIEVKRPDEEPTVVQRLRHRELRNLGHAVAVCHSVPDFLAALRETTA